MKIDQGVAGIEIIRNNSDFLFRQKKIASLPEGIEKFDSNCGGSSKTRNTKFTTAKSAKTTKTALTTKTFATIKSAKSRTSVLSLNSQTCANGQP